MSVNFAGWLFESRWPPGILAAPGTPCVIPAGRVVNDAPNQYLDAPRDPAWPKFPSVPAGWHLSYQYPNQLDIGTETGGQYLIEFPEAAAVYNTNPPGGFAYYADPAVIAATTGNPPVPVYTGADGANPPPANGWAVSVADQDLGTALPGEIISISVTAGSGASQGRVGKGGNYPVSVGVTCFRPSYVVSGNLHLEAYAWTAVYTALDMSLLRPGAWTVTTTDLNYPNDDLSALFTVTGGPPCPPIISGSQFNASQGYDYERFVVLINAGSPIPAPASWGSIDWFEPTVFADRRRAQMGLPPTADPTYNVSWGIAVRVAAPGANPNAGTPTFRVPLPAFYFPPGADLSGPASYYLYSASHFEPVTRSKLGLTLTNENVGLLPPGSAVVTLHFGSGIGSTNPPKPPGASPALLGRPSSHYNRAATALSADGLTTTGILYWRSDRPVPVMQVGGPRAGQVWDTPNSTLGVKVTASSGDNSPSLAKDHRSILYLIFNRPAQGALLCRSDDDGNTWNSPFMAISGGTHPNIVSQDGQTLTAACVNVGTSTTPVFHIQARAQGPGDPALGTLFTLNDISGAALHVADDSFGLAFAAEGPNRLALHVRIAGETSTSDWWSADTGRTWTRVQGS